VRPMPVAVWRFSQKEARKYEDIVKVLLTY